MKIKEQDNSLKECLLPLFQVEGIVKSPEKNLLKLLQIFVLSKNFFLLRLQDIASCSRL